MKINQAITFILINILREERPDSPGVVPHTFKELFREAYLDRSLTFTFKISMVEVYKSSLRDLLVRRPTRTIEPSAKW